MKMNNVFLVANNTVIHDKTNQVCQQFKLSIQFVAYNFFLIFLYSSIIIFVGKDNEYYYFIHWKL